MYGKIQDAIITLFLANTNISKEFRQWKEEGKGVNFFEMVRIDCMVTDNVSKSHLIEKVIPVIKKRLMYMNTEHNTMNGS